MSVGLDPAPPETTAPARGRRARRDPPRRRAPGRHRVSVVGVLGELLITAGVIVLAFIAWQLWINDIFVGSELEQEAARQSEEWNKAAAEAAEQAPPATEAPSDPAVTAPPEDPAPPVGVAPANAVRFGQLLVPRWGADYHRPIAEGVGVSDVLNKGELGHYPSTQMPGAIGNFAIAAHRMGHGGSLQRINELQLGDHIYVETAEGWYQYSFRNLEFVHPSGVGVLDAVPQDASIAPTERYITLTSCNPKYTSNERIIGYGTFDAFYPRDPAAANFGAPSEIAGTVNAGA